MIMNIRFVIILIVLSVSVSFRGISQTVCPDCSGLFHIDTAAAEWHGDSLRLSIRGEMRKRLKSTRSLHIQPLFISGDDTIRFPVLSCYTPSGANYRKRRVALSEKKAVDERVFVLGDECESIDYRASMNISSSMQGKIRLQYLLAECCRSSCLGGEDVYVYVEERLRSGFGVGLPLPVAVVSVPLYEANVTSIKPVLEKVKERSESVILYLSYPENQWKVLPAFGDNAVELDRYNRFFKRFADNPDVYTLQSVFIKGYASVEGTWSYNKNLSHKRADGMKEYLCSQYGVSDEIIRIEGMGEDWFGLRNVVEQSDLIDKTTILDIIDRTHVFEGREKRLMSVGQGCTYRYMLCHFFPQLRRMEAVVNYRVRSFHSDEDIANINAASVALVSGAVEEAWLYLNRVKDNPLAANNIGVYYWLCNRLSEAECYFKKAMAIEPERAKYNLEQLYKWKAVSGLDKEGRVQ